MTNEGFQNEVLNMLNLQFKFASNKFIKKIFLSEESQNLGCFIRFNLRFRIRLEYAIMSEGILRLLSLK